MKDLGIIKEREDFFRICHNYISYGTLKDGAENDSLVEKAIGHHAYYFGYSDYGGDEFDHLCCDALQKREDTIMSESTPYNGQQVIALGELADSIVAANNDPYEVANAIDFDLDTAMSELENRFITDAMEYLKDDFTKAYGDLTDDDAEWLYNWLMDHGKPTANDWDYSGSDCENAYLEYKGIDADANESVNEGGGLVVARLVRDDETGVCSLLMANGDSIDVSSEEDAASFCEKHGIKLVTESAQPITEGVLDNYPSALEYGMVVARVRAGEIKGNLKKLEELCNKYIPVDDTNARIDALHLITQIKWSADLIEEMAETSKDKLANAEKAYANDMSLVKSGAEN